MDKWPKLCDVCGIKGPSHCSKCKKVFYCSRKHQILDWQKGHKEQCPSLQKVFIFIFIYYFYVSALALHSHKTKFCYDPTKCLMPHYDQTSKNKAL